MIQEGWNKILENVFILNEIYLKSNQKASLDLNLSVAGGDGQFSEAVVEPPLNVAISPPPNDLKPTSLTIYNLIEFLTAIPNMNLKIDLPISSQHEAQINPFKEILNSILYFYLSGGSLENFSKMVSRTADSSKSAAAPFACGHIFRKGEGVYRCM